jgi:hypothetical protein
MPIQVPSCISVYEFLPSQVSYIPLTSNFYSLRVETITCNKLSHCLFDFDCPDFEQYENEKYEHQSFKFYNLYSNKNESKLLSLLDLSFLRDQMNISTENNLIDES